MSSTMEVGKSKLRKGLNRREEESDPFSKIIGVFVWRDNTNYVQLWKLEKHWPQGIKSMSTGLKSPVFEVSLADLQNDKNVTNDQKWQTMTKARANSKTTNGH